MIGPSQMTFDEPLVVATIDGEVVILGPGALHGAFNVEAAQLSALRLAEAAAQAATQGAPQAGDDAL